MSSIYKEDVNTLVKEQKPKKFKRHFNKKIRQHSKKILEDYTLGEVDQTDIEDFIDYEEQQRNE